MTVTAFRVQNFMGFEDSGWIELRPITLLFGRNSSGKSALIRALLLLRQSLESEPDDGALLFVKDDGFDYGDYRELVRDHDIGEDISFWFGLKFYAQVDRAQYNSNEDQLSKRVLDAVNNFLTPSSVSSVDRPNTQVLTLKIVIGMNTDRLPVLKAFGIHDSQNDTLLAATHQEAADMTGNIWSYASDFFDPHAEENSRIWPFIEVISTSGFLPNVKLVDDTTGSRDGEPDDALGPDFQNGWWILEGIRRSLRSFLETLSYLGPLRSVPERFYYVVGQNRNVPERGKNFVRNLVKAETSALEATSEWLKTAGIPYQIQLQPLDSRKTLYELRLQEISDERSTKISANIREVGFGITQMLPIITQAVLAQPGDTLIIEQPELHLHPRAQTELGNLFIALAQKGVNCFIETHSEHLLLRLQKQVAKTTTGQVDEALPGQMLLPGQLGVYFVNRKEKSTASRIEIGPYGDLLSTPDGFEDFFSDDMLETAERMRARLGKRSRAS